MRRTGAGFVAAVAVCVVVAALMRPVLDGDDPDRLVFTVDTPGLGVGVESGTPVVLNGVRVGAVSEISLAGSGDTSMKLDLDKRSVAGLRQNLSLDFRPQNYFGVTSVNIASAGATPSAHLSTGDHLTMGTTPDYTMGTMIEYGSDFVDGGLQQPMMDSIRRSLAYSAALQPLIHTGVIVADVVERTQRSLPASILGQYNHVAQALTPFAAGVLDAGESVYNSDLRPAGEQIQLRYAQALKEIADKFFTLVGTLLQSNQGNLTSTVQIVTELASILPAIGQNAWTPMTLRTLIERLDGAFEAGPNGSRTLKVRLQLDTLPILQSPVAAVSGYDSRPR